MEQATNPEQSHSESLVAAGYVAGTAGSMATRAQNLMVNPRIRLALSEVISEQYPDASGKVAKILDRMLDFTDAEFECPHCHKTFDIGIPPLAPRDILATIKTYAEVMGWKAPAKSMHLTAKVDAKKYKLPSDGK